MRYADFQARAAKLGPWRRAAIAVALGLPIVSGILVLTQPDMVSSLAGLGQSLFRAEPQPYRYPFDQLLSGDRNPAALLQQELIFYQERVRQAPKGGLDLAALASVYLRMARATGQSHWYLLAEQTAQQSLAALPTDNPEAIAVLARINEARHDFATALRLAAQIPEEREAAAIRTTAYLAIGQLQDAGQAVERLVDSTLSMNAFTLQAIVKAAQGQDEAALQSFGYALEVEEPGDWSNSARTRTLLGRFYYERGQLALAAGLYREALRILPDYPPALLNLAQLALRQGDYAAADRHYAQAAAALDHNSSIYDPLLLRGRARLKQAQGDLRAADHHWSEAETWLRQQTSGSNASSFGHQRDLARLLLERGRPENVTEAVSLMAAEVKRRRDGETLTLYAWALLAAKQAAAARQVAQEAIALGSRDAALFDIAARIEMALGNPTQAQLYRQRQQDVDPNFDESARRAIGLGVGLGS